MLKRFAVSSAFVLFATSAGFCADGNEGHVQLNVDVTAQSLSDSDMKALERVLQIVNQHIDEYRRFDATPERKAFIAFAKRKGLDPDSSDANDAYMREDYAAWTAYRERIYEHLDKLDLGVDEKAAIMQANPHLEGLFQEMHEAQDKFID